MMAEQLLKKTGVIYLQNLCRKKKVML